MLMYPRTKKFLLGVMSGCVLISGGWMQDVPPERAGADSFKWVNVVPADLPPALHHRTFFSAANRTDVGYFVVFPRGYEAPGAATRHFPVIYYLHGGVQGGEHRGAKGCAPLLPFVASESFPPAFLVVANGGKLNGYDTAEAKGESAFGELVSHIDQTYRTLAEPRARVLVGHSMGGRGVGRFLFKFPERFGTGVALSGGHQREKTAADTGREGTGDTVLSGRTNNTYDLPALYAKTPAPPPVRLLVVVGNKDANYGPNLDWCAHLARLKIAHDLVVVPGAGHGIDWTIQHTDRRIFDFIAEGLAPFAKN